MPRVSRYRVHANAVICRVLESLGPGRWLKTKRKALRDAYPFQARNGWVYKVWLSEVRFELGLRKRPSRLRLPLKESPGQQHFSFTQEADVTQYES